LREVEAPTFSDIRLTDGGKFVSLTSRPPFATQENPWYSFLSEAQSIPGAIVWLKDYVNRKKSTSSGTRTGDLPACSIVPQSTMLQHAPSIAYYRSKLLLVLASTVVLGFGPRRDP
jgi:hypothetical protein